MVLSKCVLLKVFLEGILENKWDALNCSLEDSSHINSRKKSVCKLLRRIDV